MRIIRELHNADNLTIYLPNSESEQISRFQAMRQCRKDQRRLEIGKAVKTTRNKSGILNIHLK